MAMGVSTSALMLGWMNYVLEIAPPGQRPTYTGLSNTLTGLLIPAPSWRVAAPTDFVPGAVRRSAAGRWRPGG